MVGLDRFEGFSLAVLVIGGIGAAMWLAFFAYQWVKAYPKTPDAGPATGELREEPPAVVNLLVNRWAVKRPAIQATVLDLAARGYLGIELYTGENLVLRVRQGRDAANLTDYERQALNFVAERATDGSAPVDAIRLDHGEAAEQWWKRFASAVASDAQKRGLARKRWTPQEALELAVPLLGVFLTFGFAFGLAHIGEDVDSAGETSGRWDPLLFAGAAWVAALLGLQAAGRWLRDTPKGIVACAHWLGVRAYLEDAAAFEDAGPAAVTVLGRNLAYAAALGIAHDAVEDLPVIEDDPEIAWTRSTGRWRTVRVEYPTAFGFGQRPSKVFVEGLAKTVFFGFILVMLRFLVVALFRLTDGAINWDAERDGPSPLRWFLVFGAAILLVAGLVWGSKALDAVVKLVRGFLDVGRTRVLEGEVVKISGGRVAVDDGIAPEAIAWFPPAGGPGLSRGDRVRVHHSPHLWYVTKVERIGPE